jgi:hypothetical protein
MGEDMATNWQFGSRHRDYLYSEARTAAQLAGRGNFPICPHCDLPVQPGQAWDEVHVGTPKVFGGKSKTVGHRRCNQLDNNLVVTPAAARANEVRKRHLGIKGPGLGRTPMRGGVRSRERKTMRHGVVRRLTHAQAHAAFLRRRYGVFQDEETPS